ncbi:MAG: Maf family nucleotide pyrophosphatase [Arenimonas sp.]
MNLILASTSRYRRELLLRLGLPFQTARPDVDETPLPNENPHHLAQRLAEAKARAVAKSFPNAWVIGADQVAELNGQAIGKPENFERAADQLSAASGKTMRFYSAFCVFRQEPHKIIANTDITDVHFRQLDANEIERYLHKEQPYDCAGSFKAEGIGISLFDKIQSSDPTGLIGLPLISLSKALRQAGINLL